MTKAQNWVDDVVEIKARVVKEVLRNAVGHVGWFDDIAWLVAFAAGPLAGVINGAALRVDGGAVQRET